MSEADQLAEFRAESRRLAQEIIDTFPAIGAMVATAESCTGGLIAGAITDIAGSSAVFDRGFVTYSNEAKEDMLGVRTATLQSFGAVSPQVATESCLVSTELRLVRTFWKPIWPDINLFSIDS